MALSVRSSREWQSLCRAMGLDHLSADSSLQDVQTRRERGAEIENAIAQWCANQDRDVATQLLIDTGVPAAPQLEIEERDAHPVSTARDFTYRHDQGSFVPCRIYNTPWLLSRTPPRVLRHAPALGEHNDYVYRDLLGLSTDQVEELSASEVLV